jgi:hypothetical protein
LPASTAEADSMGCDLDNDGVPDNRLGRALALGTPKLDLQFLLDEAFAQGELIHLLDFEYDVLPTSSKALLTSFLGTHDASDGLSAPSFYDGMGHFTIGDGRIPNFASVTNDALVAGPGLFVIKATLDPGPIPLQLDVVDARISAAVTPSTITNAKSCGAIPIGELVHQLALVATLDIEKGSPNAAAIEQILDTDHSCAVCGPDRDPSCLCISDAEIMWSPLRPLLVPDLNLVPNEGNPFVNASDPAAENDALSFGFVFEVKPAQFEAPEWQETF